MSRNFDLMKQLEIEAGMTYKRRSTLAEPAAPMEVVPVRSGHTSDAGGEEILRLIQRIFLSANESGPRQVVLCGIEEENGSSSVCARAGRTLAANSSRPVCLVDANLHSARLSGMFGVAWTTPFSGSSASLWERCAKVGANLWLAGPNILADNSRILLPVTELKNRLAELREVFEYMLIDAPGTSVCGDAVVLGQVADAAILIVEANSTRRQVARNAKETLDAAGVRMLGTVLHNRSFPIPEGIYNRL